MIKVHKSISELIGKTPMLELVNFNKQNGLKARIIAKLEALNPMGSVKDRIVLAMLDDAEKQGLINKDTLLIEPTSGNTGIALAAIGASRGYKVVLTMPETMSIERRMLLKAYGAKLVLTEGALGMKGAIARAMELVAKTPNSFSPSQFDNMANPAFHKRTTATEIWEDTDGNMDIFVAGVGTGGTISGVGEFLKQKNIGIKIVAVEPFDSPVLSRGIAASHKIQGIGAGFVPNTLNTKIYDSIIRVQTENAFETARSLAKTDGVLCGISSGAALWAAVKLGRMNENKDKIIVVILPDTGERYLSTELCEKDN